LLIIARETGLTDINYRTRLSIISSLFCKTVIACYAKIKKGRFMYNYTNIRIAIVLLMSNTLFPVTIVYNMRIAEITKRQQLMPNTKKHNILGTTSFGQWRELKNGFKQSAYGQIGTYIRSSKSFYLKIDGAVGRVKNNVITNTFKRTQTDDILFTGGYSHQIGSYGRLTYSGLFGIPTHRDFILELAQFGTGHVGIGGQFDASYAYMKDRSNVLFAAARIIHFFPRKVSSHDPCLKSLYQCREYNLKLGNLADLYVAHQTNWAKVNRIEFGYDASFVGFGSAIKPTIPDFAGTLIVIRNSFFGAYSRLIPSEKMPMGIITGLAGGFDSRPKIVGNRYMLTAWFLWGILF
jgi:hypothetical protein